MRTIHQMILAVAVLAAPIAVATAGGHADGRAGHGGHKGAAGCGCHVQCPQCEFSVVTEDVTHSCYGVECKTVCIPHFTFPWNLSGHCGCGGKGGAHQKGGIQEKCHKGNCCMTNPGVKAKTVRVLKKYEYTCPVCKCKFTPLGKGMGKGDGKKSAADAPAAGGVEPGPSEVPVPEPPAVDARILYGKPVVEQAGFVR